MLTSTDLSFAMIGSRVVEDILRPGVRECFDTVPIHTVSLRPCVKYSCFSLWCVMELPVDRTVSAASDEGLTLCVLFGKAFKLARSEFSDFYGYVYANVWSKFVLREAYAAQVQCTDAGEIHATDEQLVQNGQCLLNVQLSVADNCGRVRCGVVPFKPNESV